MGTCSGFAGSAGGLRGAVLHAPLTAPRPAPRFTVHKNFSLQEQIAHSGWPPGGPGTPGHGQPPDATIRDLHVIAMIWVTVIGS